MSGYGRQEAGDEIRETREGRSEMGDERWKMGDRKGRREKGDVKRDTRDGRSGEGATKGTSHPLLKCRELPTFFVLRLQTTR